MLVLSRGRNDKVVFPSLGVSVEILRVAGNKVRLGIDAPDDVRVLRHEIADQFVGDSQLPTDAKPPRLTHAMRNRLQNVTLGLHVLHKKLESGDSNDADSTLFEIIRELKALEGQVDPSACTADPPAPNRPWRALLVEDDANESELMACYLRMSGFEVDTAEDGLQAMVHLSKRERPDVVLMDMRMPRFDGKRTVATMRSNPDYNGVKIFAVSGTERSAIGVDIGPSGVDRWFSKPVNPQKIVDAIQHDVCGVPVTA